VRNLRLIDRGLLVEMDRRRAAEAPTADAKKSADSAAAQLRAIFADHPKQAAFFRRMPHGSLVGLLRATTKTRRAGATVGGVREFLARAVEQPGWRGTYATTTRKEAFERAWENDSGNGFAQVLRQFGEDVTPPGAVETIAIGGVRAELRVGGATEGLTITFSNGSKIDLYGAENLRMLKRKRGSAPHVVWVDEAQDFPLLDVFYKGVVAAGSADKAAECWLTGTPGRDCAGFFYEITGDEETAVDGWEVHTLAAVDNPFFGRVVHGDDGYYVVDNLGVRHGSYDYRAEADAAATEIRWENAAGRIIRQNKWHVDDPDVQREFFGKWVKTDARYVYPVYAVPDHVLIYAPPRTRVNTFRTEHAPWVDFEAVLADLPLNRRARRGYQWMFALGADFGYWPDPFALVGWAFTHELPDVFELFSWKQTKVNTDDQGAYMKMAWDALSNVVSFVGDVDGKKDDVDVWVNRLQLPIEPAKKAGKAMLEELLAGDIRKGLVHLRGAREGKRIVGSPLLTEMQHLVYLPTKPGKTREVDKHRKVAGIAHGDHCADGARYSYADLTHHLYRPPPGLEDLGEIERGKREAERYLAAIDKADDRRRREERARKAEEAQWGPGSTDPYEDTY
jgi:hypothetical protein